MNSHQIGLRNATWLVVAVALCGCVSVPAERVNQDRMAYGDVIAESWKEQMLLNVVRLRYADAPVFLDVASIINSHAVYGATGVSGSAARPPGFDSIGGEVVRGWANVPTVTYQPIMGDRFAKALLQPLPPSGVYQLLQGGWPAKLVLRTVVRSLNGVRNASMGRSADPRFDEIVNVLGELQGAGLLSMNVEQKDDGGALVMGVPPPASEGSTTGPGAHLRDVLGLDPEAEQITVHYGVFPRGPNELATMTRSMLELMLELGYGIDVPRSHEERGWASPARGTAEEARGSALVHIRSGTERSLNAYASVYYEGYWYWIDQSDVSSKSVFTFLMILFSLAETGQQSVAPLVTVPASIPVPTR